MRTKEGMRRGLLLLVLASLAWGTSTTLSSYALRQLDAVDLLAIEVLTGGAVIWCIAVLDASTALRTPHWRAFALLGICNPGLAYLLANEGLARDSASTASLLLSLDTVFTVVLAIIFLRERISRRLLPAITLGFVGTVIVGGNAQSGRDTIAGNVLILAATFSAAMYGILARRSAGQATSVVVTAYQLLAAISIALPTAIVVHVTSGSGVPRADTMHWVAGIAQGLVGVALPLLLYNRGIKTVEATVAAGLSSAVPLFGLISAVVFLHDHPTVVELVGGSIVLVAVTWTGVMETAGTNEGAEPESVEAEELPVA